MRFLRGVVGVYHSALRIPRSAIEMGGDIAMADAEGVLEARDVSEMPAEQAGQKTKSIKGADNLGWGMRNRLSRLIKPDGHCQFLPIDHGYFQGPTRCLERPGETIKDILPYADGLFVTRGVLRACVNPDDDTPIILTTEDDITEIPAGYPEHVQQPLIQTVVDEVRGSGICPSPGQSAARTSLVMDQMLRGYYHGS